LRKNALLFLESFYCTAFAAGFATALAEVYTKKGQTHKNKGDNPGFLPVLPPF